MKKLVIYYRVSTESQDEESQLIDLKNWSKLNDFQVVHVFGEKVSGFDPDVERDELEKCKSFVIDHDIKTVLVWELSRLGRSTLQTLQHIEFFTKHGVNIIFKKENLQTLSNDFTNKLVINLLSSVAEMERNTLMERVKRGRMSSALKGKRVGFTKMPLGFAADENGYIIINQKEADLVRSMYKAVASGISAGKLSKDLNAKGIPTYNDKMGKKKILRNGDVVEAKWNPKTIKNIIKNTRYKGVRDFGGKSLPVPRIVEDEIWEEANQKINDHIGYLSRTKYDYLFKSKITCGQCGYTIKSLRKYSKKLGDKKFKDVLYYTCQSYIHTGENCDCGRFRSEVFDKYLYEILFDRIPQGMTSAIKKENSESEKAELLRRLSYWNKEKESFIKEQNRIKTLFIKGFINEEEMDKDYGKLISQINEADFEISRIEKAIKKIEEPKDFNKDLFRKYYTEADFVTRREFVEQYVQRIKVYKVEKINFDLSKISWSESSWYDKNPRKITFVQPKKNEVIWYVELWAYDDPEPHPILMTSASGTNYLNYRFKFDKKERSISL
jgi:DNA invertase Pin-like site-specific DNA recombinase